jgi:hypothetical protein
MYPEIHRANISDTDGLFCISPIHIWAVFSTNQRVDFDENVEDKYVSVDIIEKLWNRTIKYSIVFLSSVK